MLSEAEQPKGEVMYEDPEDILDELDELEDDDLVLDDEDEDEDPDEKPKRKSRKSRPAAKAKKSGRKAKEKSDVFGTAALAELAGVEPRTLRMLLREEFPKDEETGRYEWKGPNDPQVKQILKRIKGGAAKELQKERLSKVKGRKKNTAKKSGSKKKKATSRKK